MTPDAAPPPWAREKPAGRAPKRSEARTATLTIRLNPLERLAWDKLAAKAGCGPSQLAAEAVRRLLETAYHNGLAAGWIKPGQGGGDDA